jgi:hypothetical protein
MVHIGSGHGELGCGQERRWTGCEEARLPNHVFLLVSDRVKDEIES